MTAEDHIPVVIGVGDFTNRSKKVEEALEPLALILKAFENAANDTGLSAQVIDGLTKAIDSVSVVRTWTWPYPDLPDLVSQRLGITPKHKWYSEHGGNSPGLLFDEAARRISKGESKVAIVAGAEALGSLSVCAAAGQLPPPGWTHVDENVTSVFSPTTRELKPDLGALHGLGAPVHVYPLYENGLRAHRGQSIKANNEESAQLYADFARIAEHNEYAWNHGQPALSAQAIGTVSKKNRIICFPYPLLQNAFNNVNMSAVCIVTSLQFAKQLGVDQDKLIYPLGGAGTKDSDDFWERPNFYSSPCISQSLDEALRVSNITKTDVDIFDFYSCFPIVPKLACEHFGLSTTNPAKPISLLGGLTSFGGAGNNYSLHAINAMVRELRKGHGQNGLVLANGGCVTYQHVVCLSRTGRKDKTAYPKANRLPKEIKDVPIPAVAEHVSGAAKIETYTIEFGRDGKPVTGHIVGRLDDGRRFIANHADDATLAALCSLSEEPIGRRGTVVSSDDGKNLFKITQSFTAKI